MIALEQVRQYLETLGLKQAVEVLDNTLDAAASRQLTYPELLAELLGVEVAARRERYLTTRTRLAHLPFSVPLSNSTSPSSPPSTSGWSRNWPTWPSSPKPPTSSCWDRPASARPTWPSPWRSGPSRMATALTSSAPTT